MNTLQIENISVDELKSMIADAVEQSVHDLLPKPKPESTYLTRNETAKKLSVSLVTLHKWTKEGIVKGHHINTRVRYKSEEVDKALREMESIRNKRF